MDPNAESKPTNPSERIVFQLGLHQQFPNFKVTLLILNPGFCPRDLGIPETFNPQCYQQIQPGELIAVCLKGQEKLEGTHLAVFGLVPLHFPRLGHHSTWQSSVDEVKNRYMGLNCASDWYYGFIQKPGQPPAKALEDGKVKDNDVPYDLPKLASELAILADDLLHNNINTKTDAIYLLANDFRSMMRKQRSCLTSQSTTPYTAISALYTSSTQEQWQTEPSDDCLLPSLSMEWCIPATGDRNRRVRSVLGFYYEIDFKPSIAIVNRHYPIQTDAGFVRLQLLCDASIVNDVNIKNHRLVFAQQSKVGLTTSPTISDGGEQFLIQQAHSIHLVEELPKWEMEVRGFQLACRQGLIQCEDVEAAEKHLAHLKEDFKNIKDLLSVKAQDNNGRLNRKALQLLCIEFRDTFFRDYEFSQIPSILREYPNAIKESADLQEDRSTIELFECVFQLATRSSGTFCGIFTEDIMNSDVIPETPPLSRGKAKRSKRRRYEGTPDEDFSPAQSDNESADEFPLCDELASTSSYSPGKDRLLVRGVKRKASDQKSNTLSRNFEPDTSLVSERPLSPLFGISDAEEDISTNFVTEKDNSSIENPGQLQLIKPGDSKRIVVTSGFNLRCQAELLIRTKASDPVRVAQFVEDGVNTFKKAAKKEQELAEILAETRPLSSNVASATTVTDCIHGDESSIVDKIKDMVIRVGRIKLLKGHQRTAEKNLSSYKTLKVVHQAFQLLDDLMAEIRSVLEGIKLDYRDISIEMFHTALLERGYGQALLAVILAIFSHSHIGLPTMKLIAKAQHNAEEGPNNVLLNSSLYERLQLEFRVPQSLHIPIYASSTGNVKTSLQSADVLNKEESTSFKDILPLIEVAFPNRRIDPTIVVEWSHVNPWQMLDRFIKSTFNALLQIFFPQILNTLGTLDMLGEAFTRGREGWLRRGRWVTFRKDLMDWLVTSSGLGEEVFAFSIASHLVIKPGLHLPFPIFRSQDVNHSNMYRSESIYRFPAFIGDIDSLDLHEPSKIVRTAVGKMFKGAQESILQLANTYKDLDSESQIVGKGQMSWSFHGVPA